MAFPVVLVLKGAAIGGAGLVAGGSLLAGCVKEASHRRCSLHNPWKSK